MITYLQEIFIIGSVSIECARNVVFKVPIISYQEQRIKFIRRCVFNSLPWRHLATYRHRLRFQNTTQKFLQHSIKIYPRQFWCLCVVVVRLHRSSLLSDIDNRLKRWPQQHKRCSDKIYSRRLVRNTPMESKAFNELGHNSCKQVFKCYAPSNVGMVTWSVIVFNCNIIRKTCSLPIRQVSFRISISVSHPFTLASLSKIKGAKVFLYHLMLCVWSISSQVEIQSLKSSKLHANQLHVVIHSFMVQHRWHFSFVEIIFKTCQQ